MNHNESAVKTPNHRDVGALRMYVQVATSLDLYLALKIKYIGRSIREP